MEPLPIVFVTYSGVQSLDITGPLEVLATASNQAGEAGKDQALYRTGVASRGREPVRSSSGLAILPDIDLDCDISPVDTLVVAGGIGARDAAADRHMVERIQHLSAHARRVASICTGAFLLAEAGLLDGRRATTHWSSCGALARDYPRVHVETDPLYVRDGNVITSAGVTAGIDMALSLVEEDMGRAAALRVARWLVLFLHRSGSQAQFSSHLSLQVAERPALSGLQAWIADNLGADLRVEALADRCAMSPRHFARAFRREVGLTPARYVERLRLEAARRQFEETGSSVETVAARCGFGTPETLRRSFIRSFGAAPSEYRRRFGTAVGRNR
jgi:transcriptional regulator GlxA family with amidase domain